MVEPLRHRQTKGAATDMFYLTPPRHISTLPNPDVPPWGPHVRFRRVQTLVREGSPLVKLRNSAYLLLGFELRVGPA